MKKIIFFVGCSIACLLSYAQCGVNPVSGTFTISTANQIVNSYYPGTGNPAVGNTSLNVGTIDARGNATALATGDLVLIIQIQGADFDASNSDAYGDGVAGGNASGYQTNANLVAGYYEYNTVASVAGSTINFSYSLANNYYTRTFVAGTGSRSYELIRVPRYYDLAITSSGSVTAPTWNGSTGGVVVLDAANTIALNGSVTVSGKGFRAGGGKNFTGASAGNTNGSGILTNTDYRWDSPVTTAANTTGSAKGEGIAGTPVYVFESGTVVTVTNSVEGYINGSLGRSAPANGGGGGTDGAPVGSSQNQYNTGGGGGSNGGAGGNGGSGWHGGSGTVSTYPFGGYGGTKFSQGNITRFILGGGGGAGTANNSSTANEYQSSGGPGGGLALLRAKSYSGTGSVFANGDDAPGVIGVGGVSNTDAAGGGGAGGTITLVISQNGVSGLSGISASAKGGKGGDMTNYYDHGPGGGGGGGYIYSNGSLASTDISGGINGKTRTGSISGAITNDFGAVSGNNGVVAVLANAPMLVNKNNLLSPCGILPVTLTTFSAVAKSPGVHLYWQVMNAVNFSRFEIEYSMDAINYSKAGEQAYINTKKEYDFLHVISSSSMIYYRLKLIDINGVYSYSRIISVRLLKDHEIVLYPNPVKDFAMLQFYAAANEESTLVITDVTGKAVVSKKISILNGDNAVALDLGKLSPGMYVVLIKSNGVPIVQQRIVKQEAE